MNVFEIVTEKVMTKMAEGKIPWIKPWNSLNNINGISGKEYTGINSWMLDGESPIWLTFKQALDLGGNVKKGEKSSMVVFWKWFKEKEDDSDDTAEGKGKVIPMLRYYSVFNLSQCENITLPVKVQAILDASKQTREFNPIQEAENIVSSMPNRPNIYHEGHRACYNLLADKVTMPVKETFKSNEAYYHTLFHELTHATGSPLRLKRHTLNCLAFEDRKDRSKEELIAEMGAAFLSTKAGITSFIEDTAAYCQSWLSVFRQDKRILIYASAAAQKAANYILNIKTERESE